MTPSRGFGFTVVLGLLSLACSADPDLGRPQVCDAVPVVESDVVADLAEGFDFVESHTAVIEFASADAAQLWFFENQSRMTTDKDLAESLLGVRAYLDEQFMVVEFRSRSDRDRLVCDILREFEYPSAPVRALIAA